jgi:transcriptional regulator
MPQGTLNMVILQVLAEKALHGYGLTQRVRQISRDRLQISHGSLYIALYRLEDRGLVAAEWKKTHTGRDARFYWLTPRGRAHLKKETTNWTCLSEAIALVLQPAAAATSE